jgi:hypothetical protein
VEDELRRAGLAACNTGDNSHDGVGAPGSIFSLTMAPSPAGLRNCMRQTTTITLREDSHEARARPYWHAFAVRSRAPRHTTRTHL